jgi:hypothetical protein
MTKARIGNAIQMSPPSKGSRRASTGSRDSLRSAASRGQLILTEMPLVHTSQCTFMVDIARSGRIEPRPCNVFGEPIAYLFYGRPAYRSRSGGTSGEPIQLCPITFILKPGALNHVHLRIYPCDTGALHTGTFDPYLTKDDRESLGLGESIEEARRYVKVFFGSNGQYFLGKVRPSIAAVLDDAGTRFIKLLRATGASRFDDRKSVVEVQTTDPVPLKDKLLCVVLPRDMLRDRLIGKVVGRKWGCRIEDYSVVSGSAPAEYYAVVRAATERLYKRHHML